MNDRKEREGSETLWGCPQTPQAAFSLFPRQPDEAKDHNQTPLIYFFFLQGSETAVNLNPYLTP